MIEFQSKPTNLSSNTFCCCYSQNVLVHIRFLRISTSLYLDDFFSMTIDNLREIKVCNTTGRLYMQNLA